MGMNSAIAVTTGELSDEDLARLGLYPDDGRLTVEQVFTLPSEERACVVKLPAHTLIVDGGEGLASVLDADEVELDRIELPGVWHVAAAVSSAGYAAYRVFENGQVVRQVVFDDGDLLTEGDPVIDESAFLIEGELDGDLLLQDLPVAVGVTAGGTGFDLFALRGQAYRAAPTESDVGQSGAARADPAESDAGAGDTGASSKKRGFFKRLFGS